MRVGANYGTFITETPSEGRVKETPKTASLGAAIYKGPTETRPAAELRGRLVPLTAEQKSAFQIEADNLKRRMAWMVAADEQLAH